MSPELFFDGKKYIPSRLAAKMTNYAPDYVSQLARSAKIPSRMVGRSWFVSVDDVLSYKNLNLNLDPKKSERFNGNGSPASAALAPQPAVLSSSPAAFSLAQNAAKAGSFLSSQLTSLPASLTMLHKVAALAASVAISFGSYGFAQSEYPQRAADVVETVASAAHQEILALSEELPARFARGRDDALAAVGSLTTASLQGLGESLAHSVYDGVNASVARTRDGFLALPSRVAAFYSPNK